MKKLQNSIFLLFFIGMFTANGQEASQWRGIKRDGQYAETGLLKSWPEKGPKIIWHYSGLGKGFSSPIVFSKGIFVTGMEGGIGYLYHLDNNGKLVWKKNYGNEWQESYPGARCTPNLNENKVYVMSGFGLLSCFDAKTGDEIWHNDLQKTFGARIIRWGLTESLLIADNKLIVTPGGENNNIAALDPLTGKTLWTSKAMGEESAYCSPQLINHKGKQIVATHTANSVFGLDLNNGKLLWSAPKTNTWSVHPNTPLYADGKIFCTSGYGSESFMLGLSDDGTKIIELWRNQTLDNQMGGTIFWGEMIIGTGHEKTKTLQALDARTGKLKFLLPDWGRGNVIMADNMIYSYNERGEVGLIQITNSRFEIKGKLKIMMGTEAHWAHPVIYEGKLYIRHGNTLMAYDVKDKN